MSAPDTHHGTGAQPADGPQLNTTSVRDALATGRSLDELGLDAQWILSVCATHEALQQRVTELERCLARQAGTIGAVVLAAGRSRK